MRKICLKLLFTALIVFLFITALSSCSEASETNSNETTVSESTTETVTEDLLKPDVPEHDFNGEPFRVFINWASDYFTDGFNADEITGEAVNDTIYNRNAALEQKYNVKIEGVVEPNIKKLVQSVLASDGSYEAVMLLFGATTLINDDVVTDVSNLPYIDMEKPWWDNYINAVYSIGDKQLFFSSEMDVTTIYHARSLFFNKGLAEDLNLDNPYALVSDGTWTLDKFTEMCASAASDIDGNSIMDHNDQWGYAVQTGITINMFYATGNDFISKDANNIPYLDVSEKSISILEKLNKLFSQKDVVMFDSDYAKVNPLTHEVLQMVFSDKRALFLAEIIQLAERMRGSDVNFGILPQPKYDEEQKNYHCFFECETMAIPKSNDSLEMTGSLIEEISYDNYIHLRSEIYETCLVGKFLRDDESEAMLDIIFANRIVSLENIFRWGVQESMQAQMNSSSAAYVSALEKIRAKVETNITKATDVYLSSSGTD